ncbi:MAG: UDP-N-acetylmuramoyl-L-alanyl-D-glutamate--2,6-diaminopimelate ligase [Syntrophomonadaceae bacterium]|nr:UDP-N-acetylmuramoyl-L-alanyl-D-glutamate--2,6-diaminopimelate ligase [Syntrophomonadaceae bacterium]
MLTLQRLLNGVQYEMLQGDSAAMVSGVEYDSRRIEAGNAFVCISGFNQDGHDFASQAVANGANSLIVERSLIAPENCNVVLVQDTRAVLPVLAANFYGRPSEKLRVVGVTGTNGKTTTTHLIRSILEESGYKVGLLGTLYASFGDYEEHLANTTPESLDIERFMHRVAQGGGSHVIMEVSSHALDLGRVDEIDFDVAVFTNFTQDHLDYHKSMESYCRAKLKLFAGLSSADDQYGIINNDDDYAEAFLQTGKAKKISYGIKNHADVRAGNIHIGPRGSSMDIDFPGGKMRCNTKLAGIFNVYNSLAAISVGIAENVAPDVIRKGIEKVAGVPGRFELIDEGQNYSVIVDYAHTPDGLENILKTAREIAEARIITVFGAGGDRDRTKRPLMGRIAAQYSDFSIITSDNPRSEDPLAIIDEIMVGVKENDRAHYAIVPDRREAIRHSVYLANKDDLVIIAGKGHEDYQIIKGEILPFDDRRIAREYIKEKERHE